MRSITVSMLMLAVFSASSQQLSIIPEPASLQVNAGHFTITRSTPLIIADGGDRKTAEFLNEYLRTIYGITLPIRARASTGTRGIRFFTRKFIKAPDKEGYHLECNAKGISIEGDTYAGTFTGMQTLIQLLPLKKTSTLSVPAVTIDDTPRFAYRGMMLDVCRHFFPVPLVKKFIDYLALHKLNYFHWHLTDDQGWRVEIKKYPLLTQIGAWRNGTIVGKYPGTGNDNLRYGGFYTQQQISEVVKYAADRFVTVVPEIEMPGHGSAAIAAYPQLSCFPEVPTVEYFPNRCTWGGDSSGKKVQQTWGVFEDVFCAGKENTFAFLQDVVDEIMPLFPSNYFHVGGDECPKANWKKCPDCQRRMKDNNLKDEHELQSYFINRMEKYINAKGKTLIGWDEILEGGLAPNAVVMSWRGEKGGIEAARQKHPVIMSPSTYVYFDYSQDKKEDSLTIGGSNPLEKVYNYEPLSTELNAEEAAYIFGVQANLWTEYITNLHKIEYMVFPRMAALSEVQWSGREKKNYADFSRRLPAQFARYKLWKAMYSRAFYKKD